jgi:hypothetical protein
LRQAAEGETDADDFQKDHSAALHFSSPDIPALAIFDIGKVEERMSYIITPKCAGQTLDQLAAQEMQAVLPAFMRVLDAIHNVNISQYPGFGTFDSQGKA